MSRFKSAIKKGMNFIGDEMKTNIPAYELMMEMDEEIDNLNRKVLHLELMVSNLEKELKENRAKKGSSLDEFQDTLEAEDNMIGAFGDAR